MGHLTRAAALAMLILGLTAAPAAAQGVPQTFTVTTTADGAGTCTTASCTLRAAIIASNNSSGIPDTIVLPANSNPYLLTQPAGMLADSPALGDLDIQDPVTIDGGGARNTVVKQTTAGERVLEVANGTGTVTLEGLTLTGGGAVSGAGLRNTGPFTQLIDSAVRGNGGASGAGGGGIANVSPGGLTVDRSLITGNTTGSPGGGGILNTGGASNLAVLDSTIDGNTAPTGGAIEEDATGRVTTVTYSTITGNNSTTPGSAAVQHDGGRFSFRASIVGPQGGVGTGENCSVPVSTSGHNIETGTSCGFTNSANGDLQNRDPVLAPLAYSSPSDPTETRVPQPGSPAINGGDGTKCAATDQRGVTRPQAGVCDSGAVEVVPAPPPPPPKPASLTFDPPSANRTPGDANTVTATVRNDDGSPVIGGTVRFKVDGANPFDGVVTTDSAGTARISWDGVHEGTDTLSGFLDTNANLTSDTGEPTGQATVNWSLPEPTQGKTANIEPVSGRIRITVKGGAGKVGAAGSSSQLLTEARQVPLSTVVDVRRGRVRMTTAADKAGDVQKGEFYGGVYTTTQSTTSTRPITELRMTESLICRSSSKRGKLTAARSRSRHLWGNAKGRYRTRGRYSTATVRGTIWVQKDSCNSTTTSVKQGVVVVKDLVKHKNVRVKAGKRYTAHKSRRSR